MKPRNPEVIQAKGKTPYWQIAEKLGVNEYTLVRWMRYELSQSRKKAVLNAIQILKQENIDCDTELDSLHKNPGP